MEKHVREALEWYRMVVAAFAHGGGDGPARDLVEDRGERARKALEHEIESETHVYDEILDIVKEGLIGIVGDDHQFEIRCRRENDFWIASVVSSNTAVVRARGIPAPDPPSAMLGLLASIKWLKGKR